MNNKTPHQTPEKEGDATRKRRRRKHPRPWKRPQPWQSFPIQVEYVWWNKQSLLFGSIVSPWGWSSGFGPPSQSRAHHSDPRSRRRRRRSSSSSSSRLVTERVLHSNQQGLHEALVRRCAGGHNFWPAPADGASPAHTTQEAHLPKWKLGPLGGKSRTIRPPRPAKPRQLGAHQRGLRLPVLQPPKGPRPGLGAASGKSLGLTFNCFELTYLPRKAVAEVSKHNEPIGRKCGIRLVRKSIDFKLIWITN